MKLSTPKYQEVANHIERSFKKSGITPGNYLPPEVVLAKRHEVTRGTIRRAMEFLEEKGLVSPVVAKRRQLLRARESSSRLIGCLAIGRHNDDNFHNLGYQRLFDHLVHEFQQRGIMLAKILVESGKTARLPEIANSEQIKCYISLGTADIAGISSRTPIISIDPPYSVTGRHIVRTNGKSAGIDMVRYLHEKGLRKIALVTTDTTPIYPFFDDLKTGFGRGLDICGLESDGEIFSISYDDRANYERCEKFFRKNAKALLKNDALILASGNFAFNTLLALRNIGISVPGQLSVVAIGGSADPAACVPPLTIFENDFDLYARYICEHTMNIMSRKVSLKSENYFSAWRLVERETVISRRQP